MSDFLSQEEIDMLLGGERKTENEEIVKQKPFDFSKVERIQKGGFPGLEIIFERWAKLFREEVRKTFSTVNMVSKSRIYVSRYGNFISKIPLPAAYVIFLMKPFKEQALFVIDSRMVFSLVSSIFGGGSKTFKIEGRDFTKLELRVINDFISIALETFEQVWKEFVDIQIELKSLELNPFLVRIVSSAEKVIVVEMAMDIDGIEVPFNFCFPQMIFLPVKDIIFSETFGVEVSEDWKDLILKKLMNVCLTFTLELDKKQMSLENFLNIREGESIILSKSIDSNLDVYIQGKKKFEAKLGKLENKFAASIEKIVGDKRDG